MKVPLVVRDARSDDIFFIRNSWLKSYRKCMPSMEVPVFNKYHSKLQTKLMQQSRCLVAANPDDDFQIYGWILYEQLHDEIGVMHYIYVKHPYRRCGIATNLYNEMEFDRKLPCLATHASKCMTQYIQKNWNLVYNPYLLIGDL